jgi:hypothetical protein
MNEDDPTDSPGVRVDRVALCRRFASGPFTVGVLHWGVFSPDEVAKAA